jgi:ion channel-forming bestrophin family protein
VANDRSPISPQHEHREESRHAKQVQKVVPSPAASTSAHNLTAPRDPFIPSVNSYSSTNTFGRGRPISRAISRDSSESSDSVNDQTPLLPSNRADSGGVFNKVAGDLIPFAHFFQKLSPSNIKKLFSRDEDEPFENEGGVQRRWALGGGMSVKHRPRVACEGENLPLEIVHYLSCWFSELEDRGTVPGTSLGSMIGALASMEDNISSELYVHSLRISLTFTLY